MTVAISVEYEGQEPKEIQSRVIPLRKINAADKGTTLRFRGRDMTLTGRKDGMALLAHDGKKVAVAWEGFAAL